MTLGQVSIADDTNSSGYPGKRPNIIVILADDYGKDAANLYNTATEADVFPETAPTPALEKLADRGVLFTNAWAMPGCTATRAGRSLGKLSSTTGIAFPLGRQTPRVGADGSRFEGVEFPPTMLNPADPHLLQRLAKKVGYKTYKLGKWHETTNWVPPQDPRVGDPTLSVPDVLNSGFDAFYGQYDGQPLTGYGGGTAAEPDFWHSENSLGEGETSEFLTSALVSKAIRFIHHSGDEPYLMMLDVAAPHFPYEVAPGPGAPAPLENQGDWRTLHPVKHAGIIEQVEAAFGGTYPPAGTGISLPPTGSTPEERTAQARAAFKSLIAYMDVQIGRLMQHVDLKDTYVIFAGDNGTQGFLRAPIFPAWFNSVEPPWDPNRSKVFLYRNGYEVPFLVTGPHIKKRGRTSDAAVTTTDIYATVLDIMGVRQPNQSRGESCSFMSVLRGDEGERQYNVTESFPPTATVGGLLAVAGASAVDDGRVVGDSRFRLIARPVFEIDPDTGATGAYVCKPGSQQDPLKDCLNEHTGIYEKVTEVEFYDLKYDPFENDSLVVEEMAADQLQAFQKLCGAINKVSKRATFYQNGGDCLKDGSNLKDIDPL
jgi:arylsulfatase A-like enzyme